MFNPLLMAQNCCKHQYHSIIHLPICTNFWFHVQHSDSVYYSFIIGSGFSVLCVLKGEIDGGKRPAGNGADKKDARDEEGEGGGSR
jgi:hypothetical protein